MEVETRRVRVAAPTVRPPGETFRLFTRVPEGQIGPIEVSVRLGELRGM